jgi:hypothetical protein
MFGQKDDNQNQNDVAADSMKAVDEGATGLLASSPIDPGPPPVASATTAPPPDEPWQHPGEPINSSDADSDTLKDLISPAGGYPTSPNSRIATENNAFPPDDASTEDAAPSVSTDDVTDAELVDIKQKALNELVPLIDKLDQPPEEKFRTIMMMIQASDDQRLVEKAYESAHSIENEEARAQALLDIVNEINYFTQQPAS